MKNAHRGGWCVGIVTREDARQNQPERGSGTQNAAIAVGNLFHASDHNLDTYISRADTFLTCTMHWLAHVAGLETIKPVPSMAHISCVGSVLRVQILLLRLILLGG